MTHFAENSISLDIRYVNVQCLDDLPTLAKGIMDICVVRLPACETSEDFDRGLASVGELVASMAVSLGHSAVLIVLGEIIDLVHVQAQMPLSLRYQLWISLRRRSVRVSDLQHLPHEHFGALVLSRYKQSLRHAKTRIEYTYCPACDRTTKDYGGKKHTYHHRGTLLSDVWRDIACDLDGDIRPVLERFADLFGLAPYRELVVFDCTRLGLRRRSDSLRHFEFEENKIPRTIRNAVIQGDCLEALQRIPDNSIDFAFADPPYNLGKSYLGYSDDRMIQDYFNWCDEWIAELTRVLKPGRTVAILNIPLWAVRHFLYMETILSFQNWIVWDALAFPVRMIMPAHYTILCFTKGESRKLPGLTGEAHHAKVSGAPRSFDALEPLADDYCLRADCVNARIAERIPDRRPLTDVWSDIHRLKHNSRRVDHPCQLPPHLLYRLISIFTKPDEIVLDCFNGAGTTSLAAQQLGRVHIGIDSSAKYCAIAEERHRELASGLDPFRKEERVLTSKNSPVPRVVKQFYKVPKKTLQLEVRRVAQQIGHIPSRDELEIYGKYPIDYYDKYFVSWGEVCAAARTTGMIERRSNGANEELDEPQQPRLLERGAKAKKR